MSKNENLLLPIPPNSQERYTPSKVIEVLGDLYGDKIFDLEINQ